MADKVYTSAEFKRERDNFHVRFFLLQKSNIIFFFSGRPFAKTWSELR